MLGGVGAEGGSGRCVESSSAGTESCRFACRGGRLCPALEGRRVRSAPTLDLSVLPDLLLREGHSHLMHRLQGCSEIQEHRNAVFKQLSLNDLKIYKTKYKITISTIFVVFMNV